MKKLMPPNPKQPNWSHLLLPAGWIVLGAALTRHGLDEAKKSRAEHKDPENAEEARNDVGQALDEWNPDPTCESEDDFAHDLHDWLDQQTDWEVQLYPSTREGKPDLVIGDLVALELKLAPSKGELDRCIGQCAAYSRQWITWMVLIDLPATDSGRLRDLLHDKGLEHIEVWAFD